VNRFFACLSFKQCVQCICNAIDRQDAAASEEFYDNLVTCDIKSVDCLIEALLVEPNVVRRLKGDIYQTSIAVGSITTAVRERSPFVRDFGGNRNQFFFLSNHY